MGVLEYLACKYTKKSPGRCRHERKNMVWHRVRMVSVVVRPCGLWPLSLRVAAGEGSGAGTGRWRRRGGWEIEPDRQGVPSSTQAMCRAWRANHVFFLLLPAEAAGRFAAGSPPGGLREESPGNTGHPTSENGSSRRRLSSAEENNRLPPSLSEGRGGKGEKAGQEPTSGVVTRPAVRLGSCKFKYTTVGLRCVHLVQAA